MPMRVKKDTKDEQTRPTLWIRVVWLWCSDSVNEIKRVLKFDNNFTEPCCPYRHIGRVKKDTMGFQRNRMLNNLGKNG